MFVRPKYDGRTRRCACCFPVTGEMRDHLLSRHRKDIRAGFRQCPSDRPSANDVPGAGDFARSKRRRGPSNRQILATCPSNHVTQAQWQLNPIALRRPFPKFASCRGTFVCDFGIEGPWQLIERVWLWFRNPHGGLAATVMRTLGLPGCCRRSLRKAWILALRELAGSQQPTARGNRQAPHTRRAGARPWLAARAPCTCWLWLHTFRLSPEDQSPRSNSTQRHTALRMTLARAPFEKMTARRQFCSSAAALAAATAETARSKSRKASPGCRR